MHPAIPRLAVPASNMCQLYAQQEAAASPNDVLACTRCPSSALQLGGLYTACQNRCSHPASLSLTHRLPRDGGMQSQRAPPRRASPRCWRCGGPRSSARRARTAAPSPPLGPPSRSPNASRVRCVFRPVVSRSRPSAQTLPRLTQTTTETGSPWLILFMPIIPNDTQLMRP